MPSRTNYSPIAPICNAISESWNGFGSMMFDGIASPRKFSIPAHSLSSILLYLHWICFSMHSQSLRISTSAQQLCIKFSLSTFQALRSEKIALNFQVERNYRLRILSFPVSGSKALFCEQSFLNFRYIDPSPTNF